MFVRHPQPVVDAVLTRSLAGETIQSIARDLGLSPTTVRRWIARNGARTRPSQPCCAELCARRGDLDTRSYAYVLGQYLGDGWVNTNTHPRSVYRLSITCCAQYPGIAAEVERAIQAVMPGNRVSRRARQGAWDVSCWSKHWLCLLPQAGPGRKHERPIALEPWQRSIALGNDADMFVRGLIHSDGCRSINRIRKPNGATYEYARYIFSNRSTDIQRLFAEVCGVLGVNARQMNRWNVAVSDRASVALLDRFVGPKY